MHLQRQALGSRTIFMLMLLFLLGAWAHTAQGQDTSTSAGAAKPVLPANSTAASKDTTSTGQPPAATTLPPHASGVRRETYVIGTEDELSINVWKEPEMSRDVPVRPDGMISLPLLGDIKAAGLTPEQLQEQITVALKKLMSDPEVTVIVTGVRSLSFNIMGQVQKPGYYGLTRRMTVLDAIALAGGFRDFAKQKKIYVLRTMPDGKQARLPFNYKNVIKGKDAAQNIELQPRDIVVVP
ncbi:MAG: polysaccharide biosynthesis/export family protein [Candidatus Korobacteraceae bacterium]